MMDNFYRTTPLPMTFTTRTRDPFEDLLSEVDDAIQQQKKNDEIKINELIKTIIRAKTREHLFKIAKKEQLNWTFMRTKNDTQYSIHSLMQRYPSWKWDLIRLKTKIINDIRDRYEIPRLVGKEQKQEKYEIQLYSATASELKKKIGQSSAATTPKKDLINTIARKRPREQQFGSVSQPQSKK